MDIHQWVRPDAPGEPWGWLPAGGFVLSPGGGGSGFRPHFCGLVVLLPDVRRLLALEGEPVPWGCPGCGRPALGGLDVEHPPVLSVDR